MVILSASRYILIIVVVVVEDLSRQMDSEFQTILVITYYVPRTKII